MSPRCGHCQSRTHVTFGHVICDGCDHVQSACTCPPVRLVPEWIRRKNEGLLRAKELVAA